MTPANIENAHHIVDLTVGEHRGTSRIFVQGRAIAASGATPGSRFSLKIDETQKTVEILPSPDGDRTVSAKNNGATPVIDINCRSLEKVAPPGTRVRVTFQAGKITVTVHPRSQAEARRVSQLKERLLAGQALDTGALCMGAGILDAAIKSGMAAAQVPAQMRFAVERDGRYIDQARRANPAVSAQTLTIEADLSEVDPHGLPAVDILVAGLPCTAASRAGRAKQRSLDPTLKHPEGHPEGTLFVDLIRFVIACEPAVVVLENVPPYRHSAGYAALTAVLQKLGYHVSDTELDAAEWGCQEARVRMAMVAAPIPIDLTGLAPMKAAAPLADILEDVSEGDIRWRSHASHAAKTARTAEDGRNFKLQLVRPEDRQIGTIGRQYWKDRTTEGHLVHPSDPGRSRLLTVTEHARVKQVPSGLIDGLGFTLGHEVLGQSIAFPPFASLGRRIAESLKAWARGLSPATQQLVRQIPAGSAADDLPLFAAAA